MMQMPSTTTTWTKTMVTTKLNIRMPKTMLNTIMPKTMPKTMAMVIFTEMLREQPTRTITIAITFWTEAKHFGPREHKHGVYWDTTLIATRLNKDTRIES